MPLAPGDRLGPYEILSAIGTGGMGEVCRARDSRLQRDVAIKILRIDDAREPGEMFAALQSAADEHSSLIIELPAAPRFDAYHDDPHYAALVHRVGFPQYRK